MTHVTELATAWLTATDQITIELVQTDETPGGRDHHLAGQAIRDSPATVRISG
jgi:hypothetical protein